METIKRMILERIDQDAVNTLLRHLKEADSALDAIQADVDEVNKEVSFWDRVNVFTKTGSEQELSHYKREYKEVKREHSAILSDIKLLIREAIDRCLPVRMKIQLAEVDNRAKNLRVSRAHGMGHNPQMGSMRIQGVNELQNSIMQMDGLISEAYDLAPGKVDVTMAVSAVYRHILKSGGFIQNT